MSVVAWESGRASEEDTERAEPGELADDELPLTPWPGPFFCGGHPPFFFEGGVQGKEENQGQSGGSRKDEPPL